MYASSTTTTPTPVFYILNRQHSHHHIIVHSSTPPPAPCTAHKHNVNHYACTTITTPTPVSYEQTMKPSLNPILMFQLHLLYHTYKNLISNRHYAHHYACTTTATPTPVYYTLNKQYSHPYTNHHTHINLSTLFNVCLHHHCNSNASLLHIGQTI